MFLPFSHSLWNLFIILLKLNSEKCDRIIKCFWTELGGISNIQIPKENSIYWINKKTDLNKVFKLTITIHHSNDFKSFCATLERLLSSLCHVLFSVFYKMTQNLLFLHRKHEKRWSFVAPVFTTSQFFRLFKLKM